MNKSTFKLQILGCHGGPAPGKRTSGFLLNDETLLDGGTIVSALQPEQLSKIKRIFLSHAHLDHIKEIPFLISAHAGQETSPIEVYAIPEVIVALKEHLFNNTLWPDFSQKPNGNPALKYIPVEAEQNVDVDGMSLTFVEVNHTVPCAGMLIDKQDHTLMYTADTHLTERIWELAKKKNLACILAEVSFPDEKEELALGTKHYTPKLLCSELEKIQYHKPVLVFHMKPETEDAIRQGISECSSDFKICDLDSIYYY